MSNVNNEKAMDFSISSSWLLFVILPYRKLEMGGKSMK